MPGRSKMLAGGRLARGLAASRRRPRPGPGTRREPDCDDTSFVGDGWRRLRRAFGVEPRERRRKLSGNAQKVTQCGLRSCLLAQRGEKELFGLLLEVFHSNLDSERDQELVFRLLLRERRSGSMKMVLQNDQLERDQGLARIATSADFDFELAKEI